MNLIHQLQSICQAVQEALPFLEIFVIKVALFVLFVEKVVKFVIRH